MIFQEQEQEIVLQTADDAIHKYFIEKINQGEYKVNFREDQYLKTEWSGGIPPVFTSAKKAFLFILKIMSFTPSNIIKITSDCTFLKTQDFHQLCKDNSIIVIAY